MELSKTSHIISKYQNLAENFGLDVEDMVSEMTEVIEHKKAEIVPSTELEVVKKSLLLEDFTYVRKVLLESIEDAKTVLKEFTLEIQAEGVDVKPGILSGYSELMLSVNQNIKLLVGIYKDIVKTEVEMYKAKQSLPKEEDTQGNVFIQNNYVTSTADIVAKYAKGVLR
jgi:hypothetical protein